MGIKIIKFDMQYTEQIIDLILNIQVKEFGVKITRHEQPDLEIIPSFYQVNKGGFWIAVNDNYEVIGSIGLINIGNAQAALRKMFVKDGYRGKELCIAQKLLDCLIEHCNNQGINHIFLGTTLLYHAAHRFYEKNNFVELTKSNLPPNFPIMGVDTKFYTLDINSVS